MVVSARDNADCLTGRAASKLRDGTPDEAHEPDSSTFGALLRRYRLAAARRRLLPSALGSAQMESAPWNAAIAAGLTAKHSIFWPVRWHSATSSAVRLRWLLRAQARTGVELKPQPRSVGGRALEMNAYRSR